MGGYSLKTELIVALTSGAIALAAAGIATWGQFKSARLAAELNRLQLMEQTRIESEKVVARYREPLARAAYDLQSRIYNILVQGLVSVYLDRGDERERSYVIDNTAFLIAQYFAWTEIIRRDIQYIDLGEDEQTRELARLQDEIYSIFLTDRYKPIFRVFAGEQRAIGERMIVEVSHGPECIGYATFLDRLAEAETPLIEALRNDVQDLSDGLSEARPRLFAIQNALIDLLAFLDPDYIRFPQDRRTKVKKGIA